MGRLLSKVFVCIFFCLVCCSGASAQGSQVIKVFVEPNYNPEQGHLSGLGSPRLPEGYTQAGYKTASPRVDPCFGSCPLPGKSAIIKVRPAVPQCGPVGCLPPLPPPPCILPRRQWGQMELAGQIFYARIKGRFGRSHQFVPGGFVEADLNLDALVQDRVWVQEYSARCQFAPHWGVMYSIMLMREINMIYQRVGLIYDVVSTCNAKFSVFGSWLLNDQRIAYTHNPVCGTNSRVTMDRTRNMVQAGAELQRCIKTLCNGATFSCDNRVGIGFNDNTFNMDVQAGFRLAVPMNAGRWGYLRGGYRLVEFFEERRDLKMNTRLDGGFAELGLIF
jgi:hypothetical protein